MSPDSSFILPNAFLNKVFFFNPAVTTAEARLRESTCPIRLTPAPIRLRI